MADPSGLETLRQFGVRNVPVVTKGDRYVFGQVLKDVAELVGVRAPGAPALDAAQLVAKWDVVLEAAQRFVRQLPTEHIEERAVANRDRSIRYLAFHVFRIAEAFLEVTEGAELSVELPNVPPGDNERTGAEIAQYGAGVVRRLRAWWEKTPDRTCSNKVPTYYGMQPLSDVLERSTWHSAQHARQLVAVLERFGIAADRPLTEAELAGLPLPAGLWE